MLAQLFKLFTSLFRSQKSEVLGHENTQENAAEVKNQPVSAVSSFNANYVQLSPIEAIELFLLNLKNTGSSHSTVKNYSSDLHQYLNVLPGLDLIQIFDQASKDVFIREQHSKNLKESSIQRKLVSLQQFKRWLEKERLLSPGVVTAITPPIDPPPPAFAAITAPKAPSAHRRSFAFFGASKSPIASAWKGYRQLPFSRLIEMSLLTVFITSLTVFGYRQFFSQAPINFAYPTSPVTPNRIMSFQGRLTSAAGSPITTATDVDFRLYNASSVGTELWDSGTCSIDPDQDGIFNTILGSTCGTEISEDVFSENDEVWLEIEVDTEILTPRQRIATVPYALNTETVQGFPVTATESATINSLLVMNEWGEVILGENSPKLRSISGTFNIEGANISITTTNNGNITLDPNGTGITNVIGNLVQDGYLYTNGATISATYANSTPLIINGTGGQIVSVNNSGDITTAGDLAINGGDLTSTGDLTINVAGGNVIFADGDVLNVGGASAQAYNFFAGSTAGNSTADGDNDLYIEDELEVDGAVRFDNSSITFSTFTGNGGLLYTNGSGVVAQTAVGDSGQCLQSVGGGTPVWASCDAGAGSSKWIITDGAVHPLNSTLDLLIGGTATTSAKFAVINVNSGTPTATLSAGAAGGAYLTATGTLQTTANQELTIGGSTTGDIVFNTDGNNNVGIGTASPGQMLTVDDTNGGSAVGAFSTLNGSSTSDIFALNFSATHNSSGTSDQVYGIFGQTLLNGSGGANLTAGGYFQIVTSASSPGTQVIDGVRSEAEATVNTSTIRAYNALLTNSAVTSSAYGYYVTNLDNSGTLTDTYGVYVGDITGGTQTNTPFSFYASDANAHNYFAGNVGIGDSSPAALLTVGTSDAFQVASTGNITTAGDLALNGDDLTSDGNLTLAATGYVRIGDTGTPGVASGDDDLYVESDIEVDGDVQIGDQLLVGITSSSNIAHFASSTDGDVVFQTSAAGQQTGLHIYRSRGSVGSETLIADNDVLGTLSFYGYDGTNFNNLAGIRALADGTQADGDMPTELTFFTTPDGSETTTQRMTLNPAGQLQIITDGSTAGLTIGAGNDLALYHDGTNSVIANTTGILTLDNASYVRIGDSGTPGTASGDDDLYVEGDLEVDGGALFDGSVTISSFTANGGILYTNGSGVVAQTTAGSNGECLQSVGGGTPTWGACGSGGTSYWTLANGSLYPINTTLDLFVGGTSTGSAKFAVLNMNSGTPVASVSAVGSGTGVFVSGNGSIQTVNDSTLTIGGTETGNISLSPLNGGGTTTNTGMLIANTNTNQNALRVTAANITSEAAFSVQGIPLSTDVDSGKAFDFKVTGESFSRGMFYSDGAYGIGPGNATRDVYIRRTGANIMQIDSNKAGGVASLVVTGDLAVNGDDITADGALTVNSASYVRVGDSGTPGSANGDDDLYVEGDLEVDGNLYLDGSTITGPSSLTLATTTTLSTSLTTFNCTDCINFDDLSDSLSLDAATTLALGANDFDINLDSTGEFAIQDGGADIFHVADDTGLITISDDVDLSFAGAENLVLTNSTATADTISVNTTTSANNYSLISGELTTSDDDAIDFIDGLQLAANIVDPDDNFDLIHLFNLDTAGDRSPNRFIMIEDQETSPSNSSAGISFDIAGSMGYAIYAEDADIDIALEVGANTISGTTADLNFSNFDVTGSSGNITTAGDLAVNGDDITSDGDLTINPAGGQVLLADGDVFNIGGVTAQGYNTISDSGTASFASSDDDLYIEDILEVGGTLYIGGTAISSSSLWSNTLNVYHPANAYAGVADLTIGGTATASATFHVRATDGAISNGTGTTVIVNDDLQISGNDLLGSTGETRITFNDGTDTTLISGVLQTTGNLDVDGTTNDIAGALNLSGNSLTSSGDLTINATGGNILFADNDVLNVGGATAQAYNFFAGSTAGNGNADGDNDLYIEDELEVDGNFYLGGSFTGPSTLTLATTTTLSTSLTTFTCTDCINFDDMSDSLTLDAATTITNALAGNLIIDLTSTGDFVIADAGTPYFTFTDGGALTQAGSGQVTFTGNVDASSGLDVTGTDLTVGATNFTVAQATGNVTTAGDLAVNGDDITSDGNLTIAASGYVRIGDTGTPGTASGDDDLYVEGDLEVDASANFDGIVDIDVDSATAFTLGDGTNNYITVDTTTDAADTLFTLTGAGGGITSGTILSLNADTVTTGTAVAWSIDGLTSGTGFAVNSTSTSTSFGKLANFDWSPTGSTEIFSTGTLFNLNVGQYGNLSKIFNVQDNGSDVFSVTQAKITSALPHEFTAAGDVSIAYDLLMTNQTASYIKSSGPMTIEAGESFENNDLTLATYGTGSVVVDGKFSIGIQRTLAVNDTTPSVATGNNFLTANTSATTITMFDDGTAGQILMIEFGDANTTIDCTSTNIDCGSGDLTASTDINAEDTALFIFDGTEWNMIEFSDLGDDHSAGDDLAEYVPSSEALEAGDVVSIDSTQPVTVQKANEADGKKVIGVVSTQPGIILGNQEPNEYPIALVGRVPVKISPNSPAILPGDPITSSTDTGKAVKATQAGQIIGQAMESWTPNSGKDSIIVFVNLSWYQPQVVMANNGDLVVSQAGTEYTVADSQGNLITQLGQFASAVIGEIRAGLITTQKLIADRIVTQKLESPLIEAGETATNLISPLSGEDLTIDLDDTAENTSELIITGDSNQPVFSINEVGDATLSGQLTTGSVNSGSVRSQILAAQQAELDSLEVKDATLSGDLYLKDGRTLDQILADNEAFLASMSGQPTNPTDGFEEFLTELTGSNNASVSAMLSQLQENNQLSLSEDSVILAPDAVFIHEYLGVNGFAQVNSMNVQQLSVNSNMLFTYNSISTLTGTLEIQPQGVGNINLLAGLMVLSDDGKVEINGDLSVTGKVIAQGGVETGQIQPNFGTDLNVKLATESGQILGETIQSSFNILDASNSAVASINASGSAQFSQVTAQGLTIKKPISQAEDEIQQTIEIQRKQTAGNSVLNSGTTELLIENDNIKPNSLVYLTATSDPQGQVLFVKAKETCTSQQSQNQAQPCQTSFTIGINNSVLSPIAFNYWIVNVSE